MTVDIHPHDRPAVRDDRVSLSGAGRRAWQVVGIALAVYAISWLVAKLQIVVVAVLIALLITAMLNPLMRRLADRIPRSAAAFALVFGGVLVLGGILSLIGVRLAEQIPTLLSQVDEALAQVRQQVPALPIPPNPSLSDLVGGAGGSTAVSSLRLGVEVLSGLALAIVLAFFLLRDGGAMWRWALSALDPGRRDLGDRMGRAAFGTVARYVRGLTVVAAADAALAGVALFVLGVPLASALTALTFLGAFIPTVGAFVVGGLAVALAFTEGGLTLALIVLAIYTAVQQLDGNVLQPWIMGHELPLHPAVVLIALTVGGLLAGIVGALLGVPVAAAAVAAAKEYLLDGR